VQELLDRHQVNPMGTRHMMQPKPKPQVEVTENVDFSMFRPEDGANVILQRAEVAEAGPQIRDWKEGNSTPLLAYAEEHPEQILSGALQVSARECGHFIAAADGIAPKRIADIGCGYGFADLLLHHRYGCEVALVDIEEGPSRHFGFAEEGAGYANLDIARRFLEVNGVPSENIATANPQTQDVAALGRFDLVLSLASCGFHYPVRSYAGLFTNQINDGGAIVLDIRKGSGGVGAMKEFGTVEVLEKHAKYATVLTRAGSASNGG
jgi:SAM-dependent methyltransferase